MTELNETERLILELLSASPNLIAIAVVRRLLDLNPPQLVQPTLWNLETRGFVDSGIRPDSHQRVYWVTESGKQVLGVKSEKPFADNSSFRSE